LAAPVKIGMNCCDLAMAKGKRASDRHRSPFPMDGTPGVDLIFPDIAAEGRRAQIEGISSPAHEDHVGAVDLLWEQLGA
jgi:mRNA degradation ribonuclease J1/J2